jgi:two-component system, chemotaxis family, protein-glutamate methylesterase/glutaminase
VDGLNEYAIAIIRKLRDAATARIRKCVVLPGLLNPTIGAPNWTSSNRLQWAKKLLIIGASTGGTGAIKDVLIRMPANCPAILINQHMPARFTKQLASRLDRQCKIRVKEAEHGEFPDPGHAYIAPENRHLAVRKGGANYQIVVSDDAPVQHHRPSVDVLFRAAAEFVGSNAVAIILTGRGNDGAVAMMEMKLAGAWTIAQDEATSVVFGKPRETIAVGGVDAARALALLSKGAVPCLNTIKRRSPRVSRT